MSPVIFSPPREFIACRSTDDHNQAFRCQELRLLEDPYLLPHQCVRPHELKTVHPLNLQIVYAILCSSPMG